MNGMNSLKKSLRQVAGLMSRYQVALLPRMLCALLQTRSVNLHRWAAVLAGSAPDGQPLPSSATVFEWYLVAAGGDPPDCAAPG